MKRINIIGLVFVLAFMVACEKETVEIDSLQIFGDEFYQGQQVNMGMAVKTSDPDKNHYQWWCEAGSFPERQQGYPVIKWTAPRENGEFLIKCTVTCGSTKRTRAAKVRVNGVFFDRFSTNTVSGDWTTTNQQVAQRNGRLETFVPYNRPTDSLGRVHRNLKITDFYPPMSVTTDIGISSGITSPFNPKFPDKSVALLSDNFIGVGFLGRLPTEEIAPTYYISEVMVDWWPMEHYSDQVEYWGPTDDPEGAPRTINASDFDARITVKYTRRADPNAGIPSSTKMFMVFFKSDAFKAELDQTHNVGLSIDENYIIRVNVDKTDVYSTDALQSWRSSHNDAPMLVERFNCVYVNRTQIYLDNLVVNNTADFIY